MSTRGPSHPATRRHQPSLTVGVIGAGWIVRAHAHALHTLNHLDAFPGRIRLKWLYGRDESGARRLADQLDIDRSTTDWREIVDDNDVDVIANVSATSLHAPVSIAAIEAGKHVLCEKPLAGSTTEAEAMVEAAARSRMVTACGFNYRFVPAMRFIQQLVVSGRLGAIRHYRGLYLQDWRGIDPSYRGGGVSSLHAYAHLFDTVRHLLGDPVTLTGTVASFSPDSEDSFIAALQFPGGIAASLEGSTCATGWKGRHRIELNGTDGSVWWDMEEFNRLHVMFTSDQTDGLGGFRDVLVTEGTHPFIAHWWDPGHIVGWDSAMVHMWASFLTSALDRQPRDQVLATFEDGVHASVLADAVRDSSRSGQRIRLAG